MIRDEKGQSMVEMALILPLLLLLLAGIIDLGRVLYTTSHLHQTSQEAVRLGGLGKTDEEIQQFTKNHFQLGDSALLQIEITPTDDVRKSGEYVKVSIDYPLEMITPILNKVIPNPVTIHADSTIRVE
ncbi:TadE/TadG family type IV pilus assembly protein [Bacillus litorisediminis]|uniref:TadE/TadG family type IV pilus assembly protein n=1 Tax=Bacillus litorisediminis TaxID=2922713 RepID=UPI001FAC1B67|nr:TadE/TadG family type IV pilus assembly protein [Bacillus litorisediminis]